VLHELAPSRLLEPAVAQPRNSFAVAPADKLYTAMMTRPRPILIAGPTASGKSALAAAVARRLPRAIIVNADSMQVYRDLRVLTARPGPLDEAQTPHALFGHVDGADAYSVARWCDDVRGVMARASRDGVVQIIVGGTGLYFKALLEGLSPIPAIDPGLRARLRQEATATGAALMHDRLRALDPTMADRLLATDTQRVTRALEVIEATGRSLSHWQQLPGVPVVAPETAARFVLMPARDEINLRCDRRFDQMLQAGALREVAVLKARQLGADLPVMRALGVMPLIAHLDGSIGLDAAVLRTKTETRQFAKRQGTWLKRQMLAWHMLNTQETERNAADIISIIDS
jgi:tRNA dimethylallyltransferase